MEKMIGHCKHGEFDLNRGCPQCTAEFHEAGAAERRSQAAEALKKPSLVRVKYFSETTGELSLREYTYFSIDPLEAGDIVRVPARDTVAKAIVSSVNVPESEIEAFRDKVKTIPANSKVTKSVASDEANFVDFMEQRGVPVKVVNLVEETPEETADEKADVSTAKMPGSDIEVISWHQQGIKLREYAASRVIISIEDMKLANDDLTIISRLKKAMEERRRLYVKPHQDQVKAINDNYKKFMEPVDEADRLTRGKMMDYNREQERIRLEQEDINRKRREAAEAEMNLRGELSEPVNEVEVVQPSKRVVTDMGTSSSRDNWVYEITDFAQLPDEFKLPNAAALSAFAKSTKGLRQVPGLKIFNRPLLAVRPR